MNGMRVAYSGVEGAFAHIAAMKMFPSSSISILPIGEPIEKTFIPFSSNAFLISFACFYYAQSLFGGIFVILIPIALTAIILLHIKDMEKAYVEIKEDVIYVVDYYWGIKKEKHIPRSDITSAEICIGYSHKVKGYRFSFAGMRYIVFRNGKKSKFYKNGGKVFRSNHFGFRINNHCFCTAYSAVRVCGVCCYGSVSQQVISA